MSKVESALREGRVVFVAGARSRTVKERLPFPVITKDGYRHGIGGTFVRMAS